MSPTRKSQSRAAKPKTSETAAARKPAKAAPKTPKKASAAAAPVAAKRDTRAPKKPTTAAPRGAQRSAKAKTAAAEQPPKAPVSSTRRGAQAAREAAPTSARETPTRRTAQPRGTRGAPRAAARESEPRAPQRTAAREYEPLESASNEALQVEPVTNAEPAIPLDTPEREFSARVTPVPADRPRPQRRRAIFIDVENTSRASQIQQALDELDIDHADACIDLVASGNWRVIGNETARILARKGAQLIHSAPATGVRDWSDLRIAVAAGVWLASARPGDTLQLISDDRAFDAVGDVAATLGVEFMRLSYRNGRRGETSVAGPAPRREPRREPREPRAARPPREETAAAAEGQGEARRPRGRRRGGRSRGEAAGVETPAVSASAEAPETAAPAERSRTRAPSAPRPDRTAGTAPTEDLLSIVSELLATSPTGVPLDALARRLKELGFSRPPGSPRLVTRVRAIRELAVAPNGVIRLASSPALPSSNGGTSEPATPAASESPGRRTREAPSRGAGRAAGQAATPAASSATPPAARTSPVQTAFTDSGFAPSAPPDFDAPVSAAPAAEAEDTETSGEEGGSTEAPRRSRRRGGRGRRKPEQA